MSQLITPTRSPLYPELVQRLGYLPNYARVFALAPDAYAGWVALNTAIKAGMDERRYELVTLVAARRIGSKYCALAHAAVLRDRFFDEPTVRAIVAGWHQAGLPPADVAILDFADRIAADPHAAAGSDFDALRGHGLSDVDIFHVVLAVMARRFFAGAMEAVAAVPDPELDPIRATVGAG